MLLEIHVFTKIRVPLTLLPIREMAQGDIADGLGRISFIQHVRGTLFWVQCEYYPEGTFIGRNGRTLWYYRPARLIHRTPCEKDWHIVQDAIQMWTEGRFHTINIFIQHILCSGVDPRWFSEVMELIRTNR
jgi:hypothetical protein